jgi:hypothetical protein
MPPKRLANDSPSKHKNKYLRSLHTDYLGLYLSFQILRRAKSAHRKKKTSPNTVAASRAENLEVQEACHGGCL